MADFEDEIKGIMAEFRALAPYDWRGSDMRHRDEQFDAPGVWRRYGEFFHPDEPASPHPGYPAVEIYDDSKAPVRNMLFGDMLHYLPQVDPKFSALREEYRASMTPEQRSLDRRVYENSGDPRSYDDWMDYSRLDAHLRGYLSPDSDNEWSDSYSNEQVFILDRMMDYLRQGK